MWSASRALRAALCLACLAPAARGLATRRGALIVALRAPSAVGLVLSPGFAPRADAKCKDIDSCREEGDRRDAEADRKAGPMVTANGVRFREMAVGDGDVLVQGDSVDIKFQVLKGNGDLMYGVPDREPGAQDEFETIRATLGNLDVPLGVERALLGSARGARRRVELGKQTGFETSDWKPKPTGFAGKKRIERYQGILAGNGLQPGYDATILFEFEVVKVRKLRP
ncbi:hypothetical protein M885DRAFT_511024 [Pelagophyceae sp. CCMP2097]|nr:hypothetical protein M885DRAFT_511024 [Pelagophyceae sp. CCMP2097]